MQKKNDVFQDFAIFLINRRKTKKPLEGWHLHLFVRKDGSAMMRANKGGESSTTPAIHVPMDGDIADHYSVDFFAEFIEGLGISKKSVMKYLEKYE